LCNKKQMILQPNEVDAFLATAVEVQCHNGDDLQALEVLLVCIYLHGASDARVIAIIACLCVCLSVTHAGIVSKRLNVGSHKQHHVIAQGL